MLVAGYLIKSCKSSLSGFNQGKIDYNSLDKALCHKDQTKLDHVILQNRSTSILNEVLPIFEPILRRRLPFSRVLVGKVYGLKRNPCEAKDNAKTIREGECRIRGYYFVVLYQ